MALFFYTLLWILLQSCTASPNDNFQYTDTDFHEDATYKNTDLTPDVVSFFLTESYGNQPTDKYPESHIQSAVESSTLNKPLVNSSDETNFDGYTTDFYEYANTDFNPDVESHIQSAVENSTLNKTLGNSSDEINVDGYTTDFHEDTTNTNTEFNKDVESFSLTESHDYDSQSPNKGNYYGRMTTVYDAITNSGNDSNWLNTGFGAIQDSGNYTNWLNAVFGGIPDSGNNSRDNWNFEQSNGEDVNLSEIPVVDEVNEYEMLLSMFDNNDYTYYPWRGYYIGTDYDSEFYDTDFWATYDDY